MPAFAHAFDHEARNPSDVHWIANSCRVEFYDHDHGAASHAYYDHGKREVITMAVRRFPNGWQPVDHNGVYWFDAFQSALRRRG